MNFTVDNLKHNLRWLVCSFLGLFHFVTNNHLYLLFDVYFFYTYQS